MLTNEHTKPLLQLAASKSVADYSSLVDEERFSQLAHRFFYPEFGGEHIIAWLAKEL